MINIISYKLGITSIFTSFPIFKNFLGKMTVTRVANIYSMENTTYRQNLEEFYPLLFSTVEQKDYSTSTLLKLKSIHVISQFKDIDLIFKNKDKLNKNQEEDDSYKKYNFLLKLESFCEFTIFFLQNFSEWKKLKGEKMLKSIQEKLEEFLSHMHKYQLDSLSTVETARFYYIQGKFTIAKKLIDRYLSKQE
jgi:hypothetical protein